MNATKCMNHWRATRAGLSAAVVVIGMLAAPVPARGRGEQNRALPADGGVRCTCPDGCCPCCAPAGARGADRNRESSRPMRDRRMLRPREERAAGARSFRVDREKRSSENLGQRLRRHDGPFSPRARQFNQSPGPRRLQPDRGAGPGTRDSIGGDFRNPRSRRGSGDRLEIPDPRGNDAPRRRLFDGVVPHANDDARPRLRRRDRVPPDRPIPGSKDSSSQPRRTRSGKADPQTRNAPPEDRDAGPRTGGRNPIRAHGVGASDSRPAALLLATMQETDESGGDADSYGEAGPPMRRGAGRRGRFDGGGPDRGPRFFDGEEWAEDIEAVRAFLEEHFPDRFDELKRLRTTNPRQFRMIMGQMMPRVHRMMEMMERSPEAGRQLIREQRLGFEIERFTEEYFRTQDEKTQNEIRLEVRRRVEEQFDIRLQLREMERERLEHRLEAMRRTLDRERQQRNERIQQVLDDLGVEKR